MNNWRKHMNFKLYLGTASLALVMAPASASAQQISIGHLEDLSGGTADVGTPYGQAVVDTFAWVNKNGGVGGKKLSGARNHYGQQVRTNHGMGPPRYRGADRLPRPGQDSRHVGLLCRGADRSRGHQRQGQA